MIERREDWRDRLKAYLRACARDPFAYGTLDCALFAAGAVEAMTGFDGARGFRGYTTSAGAARKLRAKGYAGPDDAFAAALPEIAPQDARAGDVVAVGAASGLAMGVVQGEAVYVMREAGMGLVPLTDAIRAFRV